MKRNVNKQQIIDLLGCTEETAKETMDRLLKDTQIEDLMEFAKIQMVKSNETNEDEATLHSVMLAALQWELEDLKKKGIGRAKGIYRKYTEGREFIGYLRLQTNLHKTGRKVLGKIITKIIHEYGDGKRDKSKLAAVYYNTALRYLMLIPRGW